MNRTYNSRKRKDVVVENDEEVRGRSLDDILEGNRDFIKVAYRARLDTLGEADEVFEDSLGQKHSVWEGRFKEAPRLDD